MPTLMDVIMQEYRTMPAGSPDYSLGSRRTMMQPGGQFNDAGRLGNMGMRQTLAAQAPAGTSPITPGMPSPFGSLSQFQSSSPQAVPVTSPFGALPSSVPGASTVVPAAPMRPSPFEETNMPAPVFAPATVAQGMTNVPLPPRIPGGQTRGVREPGFFERLFQGTDFQSNNMPVTMAMPNIGAVTPEIINYGDPNSAADFFRADRALMQQNPAFFGLLGGTNG